MCSESSVNVPLHMDELGNISDWQAPLAESWHSTAKVLLVPSSSYISRWNPLCFAGFLCSPESLLGSDSLLSSSNPPLFSSLKIWPLHLTPPSTSLYLKSPFGGTPPRLAFRLSHRFFSASASGSVPVRGSVQSYFPIDLSLSFPDRELILNQAPSTGSEFRGGRVWARAIWSVEFVETKTWTSTSWWRT